MEQFDDDFDMEAEIAAEAAAHAAAAAGGPSGSGRRPAGRIATSDDEDDPMLAPPPAQHHQQHQQHQQHTDEEEAVAAGDLFGDFEEDGFDIGGVNYGANGAGGSRWAGHADALDEHQRQMQDDAHQQQVEGGDANSQGGLTDATGDAPTYEGYDEELLRVSGPSQPFLMPRDSLWKSITAFGPRDMRPKRAMRVLVPVELFRRDAEWFRSWQLPKGAESRCKGTAAIISLLFAGTKMGQPSGKHEEKMRAQAEAEAQGGAGSGKAKAAPLTKVSRYTYAPHDDESDSYPMFQIGIEDIYDDDGRDVLALGVWLFIFDENHSTSHLMKKVVENTRSLKVAKQVTGASATSRSKDASNEAAKHDKAGFGFGALDKDFDSTVGLQYQRVSNMDDWMQMLDLHSGRSSGSPGRPTVKSLAAHTNCGAGRRAFEGDYKTGCGGKHPLAPEFVFNAKRAEGLAFGAVHLDGSLMDVHPDQLNPSTYWRGDGYFCLPLLRRPAFWLCTSYEKLTIFDLPLTRPLQGTVSPGDDLMRLFLEVEQRQKNKDHGRANAVVDVDSLRIDQAAVNRLRSMATRRDEHQRAQDQLLRNTLMSYDLMTPAAGAALSAGGEVDYNADAAGDEANYTIKTVSMLQRVKEETDRLCTKIVSPWVSRMEKELREMCKALQTAEVPEDDAEWDAYWAKRSNFNHRHYLVKKDLVQYHLRLQRSCFLSTKDSATLPAGYKAMFRGLEEGVAAHNGSASIAFNGGKNGTGRQLMNKDRQVWGSLQEWLRNVFVDCCRIDGRDRRIMDEIYLHVFEMYADTTFVLVIASEKGKGKSVRAIRMAHILPEGWCSFNSATTQRSGMNGNNSPSNGTTVVCDEMISDLVPSEPTERMEFWKTIVGKREFEIERTRLVKNADGTEQHMTFKIVTDHKETYLICCNMGQCFTAGSEEPTAGKEAMIQRTVCIQARAEADDQSADSEFKANLKHPEVAPTIADFQLFTSLCGFVRMAMVGLDWLQPDFAIANLIFKEGDKMLEHEYGKSKPEPRRLVKRAENLKTVCVHEAVARVYMFKQTAMAYEAGRPDDNGRGKKFEIGDLWDVIRTMRPTREMILAAWSHSLEYSIGTSSHGMNVMTAVCEKLGFIIDYLFRRLPTKKVEELAGDPSTVSAFELESYMTEVRQQVAGGSSGADAIGASKATLESYEQRMRHSRILRNDFRRKAADKTQESQPMQAIEAVVGPRDRAKYADALFPTAVTASLFYKPTTLLQWSSGRRVAKDDAQGGRGGALHFKERQNQGGAKTYDFGWIVLYTTGSDRTPTWAGVTKECMKECPTVNLFDMHVQGVADALFMLASTENKQLLAEQPRLPWVLRGQNALVDQNNNVPNKESVTIGLRPVTLAGAQGLTEEAHKGDAVEARLLGGANHRASVSMHKELDTMHQRCRLPSLQPLSSTKVVKAPPLRRLDNAIEVNSVAAFEHVHMLLEGILRCSRVAGLKGLQERFQSGGTAPACLRAWNQSSHLGAQQLLDTVRVLPWSIDLMQMAWTLDLASRFYTPNRNIVRDSFNAYITGSNLGLMLGVDALPELTTRYPGFPRHRCERTEALRLISVKLALQRPPGQHVVDISKASPLQDIDAELLRYETEVAIGGPASDADIEEHRRSLIGSGYTYGVEGDVFDYDTWANHVSASMVGRGNTDGLVDENGAFTDEAHTAMLDAEFMLQSRLIERKCMHGWDGFKHLDIVAPTGSTYNFMETSMTTRGPSGTKRKAPEPPRLRLSASQRLGNAFSLGRGAPGPSGARAIGLRQGDSRDE